MTTLLDPYRTFGARLDALAPALLPTLARLVFLLVLFWYFINSGLTKLGDGVFGFLAPSTGAYVQIFPKALEAVSYDTSQLSVLHWGVATAGTIAEFVLPVLIIIGLFTRLAALGMIGFIAVQSLTDIYAHGLGAGDIGSWFDNNASALILDQRAFWVFLLVVLIMRGAGPLSVDARVLKV